MLDPRPLADRFVPGTPRLDNHHSVGPDLVSPSRSRSGGLRHATSMFGWRSLQNLRIHHTLKNSIYGDQTNKKENNKIDIVQLESRVVPQWLDRDFGEVPRPQTSPVENRTASCTGPAGMLGEEKPRTLWRPATSDQLFNQHHRRRQSITCIEPLRYDGDPLDPKVTASPDADTVTETADGTGPNRPMGSDKPLDNCGDHETDTKVRRRRAREWQRAASVRLHPGPLNSNPTRDDNNSTPRATTSFTAEMQAKLNEIRGSLINIIGRPASRWWEDDASGGWPQRSLTPATSKGEAVAPQVLSPLPVTPGLRNSAISDASDLFFHQQLVELKSENITLKSLKKLHDEAFSILREEKQKLADRKAALEAAVSEAESELRNGQVEMDRQESTIGKLSRQLSSKDAEHSALVANFATELASRDNELIALKDEKWTLQRKVTELEQTIAQTEAQLQQWGRMGRRIPRKLKMSSLDNAEGDSSAISSTGPGGNIPDDRAGHSVTDCPGDTGNATTSGLNMFDTPTAGSPKTRMGDMGNPNSGPNPPFTPSTSPSSSLLGWAATTSPRGVRPLFNFQSPPLPGIPVPDGIQANSTASASSGTRPSSRRRRSLSSQTTAVAMTEEEIVAAPSRPTTSHDQLHHRGQGITAQQKALAAEQFGFEKTFLPRLNKQASLNELNLLGNSKVQKLPSLPMPPSMSTPELPVLTYDRSLTVWLDRVVTTFKYLDLSSFLRLSDAAATKTSERLHAAILLKNAVNDDILEDVLFLLSHKETQANSTPTEPANSSSECPHSLLSAILTIHGLVSGSPSEVGWVDRISEAELGGVEDFASLALCIDKRRGTMFGAPTEHYDDVLPKIQESATPRVVETDSLPTVDGAGGPWLKKKSQLSTWMGGLVKRRQTRLQSQRVET